VKHPDRGEVWLVDLGMVAKVRPCLIVSIVPSDNDRALTALVPHTTSTRQTRFEVASAVRFLKSGAFDVQNLITIPHSKLIRKLGVLSESQMLDIDRTLKDWLGLE
jgi:mRNA interferase MazF